MNINLAYTTDDEHKVHKYLNTIGGYNGSLKDEFSFLNPVYLCQVPEGSAVRANYASIPDLDGSGRVLYYFVKDVVLVRSGVCEIHLELDPLMTYETEIKNLICTVDKNEKMANAYLIDNEYKILACDNIVTIDFPQGFGDEQLILLTIG